MHPLHEEISNLLKSIEDVTWLSYRMMLLSSMGIVCSKKVRKKLSYRYQKDYVVVGFVVSNHKEKFATETTLIKSVIQRLGYKSAIKSCYILDYMNMHENDWNYHLFRFCPYYPLKITSRSENKTTLSVSSYSNDVSPLFGNSQYAELLNVQVHKDDIRNFLMELNNHNVGIYVQHIIYSGSMDEYKDVVGNKNYSDFLLNYHINDVIKFQPNRRGNNIEESLTSLKIKPTKVLCTAISKKKNITYQEALQYVIDRQHSLLDSSFVKVNFRLLNANKSTWGFIIRSMDVGNVVPSLINWKDGIPQGGVVYCPVEYFPIFMNKLKLFNNSYLNLNYYPYFHQK